MKLITLALVASSLLAQVTLNETTTSATMTAAQLSVPLTSSANVRAGFLLYIVDTDGQPGELVSVTRVQGNTATVQRGRGGYQVKHDSTARVLIGPDSRAFGNSVPVGGCSPTDTPYTPVVDVSTGITYTCTSGAWIATNQGGGGGGGYNTIQSNDGTAAPQRSIAQFMNSPFITFGIADVSSKTQITGTLVTGPAGPRVTVSQPIVLRSSAGGFNQAGTGGSTPTSGAMTDAASILTGAYNTVSAADTGSPTMFAHAALPTSWDGGSVTARWRFTQTTGGASGSVTLNTSWACVQTGTDEAAIAWSAATVTTVTTPAFRILTTAEATFTPTCTAPAILLLRVQRDPADSWANPVTLSPSELAFRVVLE